MQRAHVRDRALGDSLRAGASWAAFNGRERLAEVVAYYGIALRQRGAEFLGRCPLCGCDPSLAVKPAAGTVRCSGCGARHDAVGFIQAVEKTRRHAREAAAALEELEAPGAHRLRGAAGQHRGASRRGRSG
jgi:hypothetical protein